MSGVDAMPTVTPPRPRAVVCGFCGHPYIQPCTAETEAACPNMIWLRGAAQQSTRHHYIPQFYLRRWAGDDDKVCEFSRPHKNIYRQRVYPIQTGFKDRALRKAGRSQIDRAAGRGQVHEPGRQLRGESFGRYRG